MDRDAQNVGDSHSGMRMRPGVVVGRLTDLVDAIDDVEALVIRTREDARLATTLRRVERCVIEAECAHTTVGGRRIDALLDANVAWAVAVARAISSALAYRTPQQRRTAMELASEESSMRLLMSVEPARLEARADLVSDDMDTETLRRALGELDTRIDVTDRMLHARIMTAAAR